VEIPGQFSELGRGRLWSVTHKRPITVATGRRTRRRDVWCRVITLIPDDSKATVRLMDQEDLPYTVFLQIGTTITNGFTYLVLLAGPEIVLLPREDVRYLNFVSLGPADVR
jgi:hypothetical protein